MGGGTLREMSKPVPNERLTVDLIPGRGAPWQQIETFALSFPEGGAACGPLALEYKAKGTLPEELSALRACLWFEQRRWRHWQAVPTGENLEWIHRLLEAIRAHVVTRAAPST